MQSNVSVICFIYLHMWLLLCKLLKQFYGACSHLHMWHTPASASSSLNLAWLLWICTLLQGPPFISMSSGCCEPSWPKGQRNSCEPAIALGREWTKKLRNIHVDDIDTCKHNEIFKGSRWIIYPMISDLGWSSAQAPFPARSHKEHDEGEEAWWNQTMGN